MIRGDVLRLGPAPEHGEAHVSATVGRRRRALGWHSFEQRRIRLACRHMTPAVRMISSLDSVAPRLPHDAGRSFVRRRAVP
jgi:hypothetical protein